MLCLTVNFLCISIMLFCIIKIHFILSSYLHLGLPSGLLLLGFPYLSSPLRVTRSSQHITFNFNIIKCVGLKVQLMKHFNLWFLQSPVPSTLLGPNILLLIRLPLYTFRLSQFRLMQLPYIQVCTVCVTTTSLSRQIHTRFYSIKTVKTIT
jgi:hypothetical protein